MTENKKILVVDCNASGVAGDMFLSALLDLGVNVERVISAIKTHRHIHRRGNKGRIQRNPNRRNLNGSGETPRQ
jgi:uncharacterized protein (DUF111 family)